MFVYTIIFQNPSFNTRRLATQIMHALTIHPRQIQTMWSHNHDAGNYETLYEVDRSSGDVIYWTMAGAHVVPDRQQYDEHTHQADMIPGVSLSTPWAFHLRPLLQTSTRWLAAHIMHALTIHPREIKTLWSSNDDSGSYETLYKVDSSSGDVVIYWTMTSTHVVPDRQQHDEHTHQADVIPGVSISYQTAL